MFLGWMPFLWSRSSHHPCNMARARGLRGAPRRTPTFPSFPPMLMPLLLSPAGRFPAPKWKPSKPSSHTSSFLEPTWKLSSFLKAQLLYLLLSGAYLETLFIPQSPAPTPNSPPNWLPGLLTLSHPCRLEPLRILGTRLGRSQVCIREQCIPL